MTSGFLHINKPADWTSHDVVAHLRQITGEKKIGHAGTLDPFATGLLIVGISREATRELDKFLKQDKEYIATLRLGATSDTYDLTGKIKETDATPPNDNSIKAALEKFKGEQEQVPPMYSAKKVGGKKLYELARKGEEIKRKPSKIVIHEIELLNFNWPSLEIRVSCSSGTYIRSLAHDIGAHLGTGAYLEKLERTKIGEHKLSGAIDLEKINQNNWTEFLK